LEKLGQLAVKINSAGSGGNEPAGGNIGTCSADESSGTLTCSTAVTCDNDCEAAAMAPIEQAIGDFFQAMPTLGVSANNKFIRLFIWRTY